MGKYSKITLRLCLFALKIVFKNKCCRWIKIAIGESFTSNNLFFLFNWKEGNVLFNDALNTFYLQLYGVGLMVKGHSDSERGNPLLPHGQLFLINSKGSLICTIPQTGLCYTSRGALAGTRNSSMGLP